MFAGNINALFWNSLCLTHLHIAVSTGNDVNALPILFVLQDAGVVLGCENEQQVLSLTLQLKQNKKISYQTSKYTVQLLI